MKQLFTVLSIGVLTASLAACGTIPGLADVGAYKTGIEVTDAQLQGFTDRSSTQADVVAKLGQPNRKAQVGSKEVWYYDFTEIGQAIIGRNRSETTVFEFKGNVLVSHYKTGGTSGQSSNPLLKAAGM